MIKSGQISEIRDEGFHYITAITKPQINKFLRKDVFQLNLFDERICEIEHEENRYILRRNPLRAQEIERTRNDKKESVECLVQKKNLYLAEHRRARTNTAVKEINNKIERLKLSGWLKVETKGRNLQLKVDDNALYEESKLDGCYVITSDLPKEITAETIHDRYKDLAKVEQAFRTCKTAMLEMRPWFVQTEKSTRGHAFVVMLAFMIVRYLDNAWTNCNGTVSEGLMLLSLICSIEMVIKGQGKVNRIPTPRKIQARLFKDANVRLPHLLPNLGTIVVSRKKLKKNA